MVRDLPGITERRRGLCFPFERAAADVCPVEHAFIVDGAERFIDLLLRLSEVIAQAGDTQDAAAGRYDMAILVFCAGMKDFNAVRKFAVQPAIMSPFLTAAG